MWIVLWDPFLMKKLLKSEIYRSVNSARCVLIGWEEGEKSNFAATVHAQYMNSSRKSLKRVHKKKKKYQTQNSSFPSNPNIALKPNAKINREWREPKIYGLLITHLQLATCNLQHMLFILFKVYNVKQFSFWRMMLVFIHHIYNTSRSLSCILFLGGEKKRVKIKKDDKK